jgi:pSer/pThr/pTyr-binding forkhead associated (FHA) protein
MPVRLVALDGGPDICVDGEVVVGRDPDCEIRIDSQSVSRRHCVLIETSGGLRVHDLDSTNGTWINSQQVRSGWLGAGDILAIAYIRFQVGDHHAEWPNRAETRKPRAADRASPVRPSAIGLFDNR